MKEKFISLKNNIIGFLKSLLKHPLLCLAALGATISAIITIYVTNAYDKIWWNIAKAFLMAVVFLPVTDLLTEKIKILYRYLIQTAVAILTGGAAYLCFYLSDLYLNQDYGYLFYFGVMIAVLCVTVFLFTPKNECKVYYSNIFKNFLFCLLLVTVGVLGGFLLLYAVDSLIHEFDDIWDLEAAISYIFYIFIFINLFSYYLFEKREEPVGKGFKIIFLYVLFPVYFLLLLILYIYLLKALFTWSLPNGQINWFVSFATAFYMVFYFVLKEYEDLKIIKWFYKVGGLIFVPLILVQFPAYFIRVNAYGLTGWRYSSLFYNIFATLFIASTFIKKGKYTKYSVLVLGIISLLISVTPFNLIEVPKKSQITKMVQILKKYEMIENNKLTNYNKAEINSKISEEDRRKLTSAYHYLHYTNYFNIPEWLNSKENFKDQFGIDSENKSSDHEFKFTGDYSATINIDGYKTIKRDSVSRYSYYNNSENRILIPGISKINFDVTEYIRQDKSEILYITVDENTCLVIYDYSYRYNLEIRNFKYFSINYYILGK